jgi:hypothetical protein
MAYTHPGHRGKWINRFKQYGRAGFNTPAAQLNAVRMTNDRLSLNVYKGIVWLIYEV